jgi:hypothetical protein
MAIASSMTATLAQLLYTRNGREQLRVHLARAHL